MKTKMLLLAALVGTAALSANAGVRFGCSVGLPLPVVVAAPVACAPATEVQTVPVCPGAGYVWAAGCWSYRTTGYAWMPGAWSYHPAHAGYGHYYAGRRW